MTHPDFTDPALMKACQNRRAMNGNVPCPLADIRALPCGECLRDCGIEPGDEYDEAAAVARML